MRLGLKRKGCVLSIPFVRNKSCHMRNKWVEKLAQKGKKQYLCAGFNNRNI